MSMNFCPLMFALDLIIGIPYFTETYALGQIINVPVRSAAMIDMMIDASLQTPGPESTADIQIEAGLE